MPSPERYLGQDAPQAIPIPNKSRAGSILDVGGADSLNNFASSLQRSVNYLSTSYDSKKATAATGAAEITSPLLGAESVPSHLFKATAGSEADVLNTYQSINSPTLLTPIMSGGSDTIEIIYNEQEVIKIITHKSTPTQTIFNSINVLVGLGVFSIPLALHLSGWVLGIVCLTLAAYLTNLSAILLGRIMKQYPQLKTYQDIGMFAFGRRIGTFILFIFTLDLLGAGISMIILFADSFNTLFPSLSKFSLKVLAVGILFVLNFLPLRLLSFLSLIGITCTTVTCLIIFTSGFLKNDSPGSLLNIMPTNLWPLSTIDFFFALGLYLAPWGGHATFPEIYVDQALPAKFDKCMNLSFSFAYMVDLLTGIFGFLMFGHLIEDEVTKNILKLKGYPGWIGTIIVILMGLLPISKLPLVSRPIITALDLFNDAKDSKLKRLVNRFILSLTFLTISLLLTNFAVVMSLLGSAICFTVCITLPVGYYIRIFDEELTRSEKMKWWTILIMSLMGAIGGTLAVILN